MGIVVGGAEPGIVYRQGTEVPQALSLFDTEHQEITAITCDGDYVQPQAQRELRISAMMLGVEQR